MGLAPTNRRSLYLDTSLYIYFFEDHPVFADRVEAILTQAIDQNIPVFASEILFTELLVLPLRKQNQKLVDLYLGLSGRIPSLQTIAVTRDIAVRAARLRAKYGLRTPDAIHLATAIEQKVDCFWGSDHKLKAVSEIVVKLV